MEGIAYGIGGLVIGAIVGFVVCSMKKAAPAVQAVEAPKPAPVIEKPNGAPLQLLAILQAESRLIDFLLEEIAAAPDVQVGISVKEIHRKAQAVLRQHLVLEPVVAGLEGSTVSVPKGFDPSAVRVLGNVTGEPPYRGELQHPGWRVKEIKLSPLPKGTDAFVLQPAEVQIV